MGDGRGRWATLNAMQQAVLGQMSGTVPSYPNEAGYCLRNVRLAVMSALAITENQFWARFAHTLVDDHPRPIESYWARDVQLSLRTTLGVTQVTGDELQGGEIGFSWKLGEPQGHTLAILSGGPNAFALENTHSLRGVKISGFNRLSRLDERLSPDTWEFFRLPEAG